MHHNLFHIFPDSMYDSILCHRTFKPQHQPNYISQLPSRHFCFLSHFSHHFRTIHPYIEHQTQYHATDSSHINTRQRTQAIIAGFIGTTMIAWLAIFSAVTFQIHSTTGLSFMVIYFPRTRRQNITNVEITRPILHANRFWIDPIQSGCLFLRNIRTNAPKSEYRGDMKTLMMKSIQIAPTRKRGISYSALSSTSESDVSPSTRVIPVAIRISCSSTNPYLSALFDISGRWVQYINITLEI